MALGCGEGASRLRGSRRRGLALPLAWGRPIIGVDIGAITAIVAAHMDSFAPSATARLSEASSTSKNDEAERQQYETYHAANRSPLSHGPLLHAAFGMVFSSRSSIL